MLRKHEERVALERKGTLLVCFAALAVSLLAADGVQAQSNDLMLVKVRIQESLSADLASVATIQSYQTTLQTNGTWADLDYASTAITAWSPRTHLERMKAMATGYAWGGLQGDAALRDDIFRA